MGSWGIWGYMLKIASYANIFDFMNLRICKQSKEGIIPQCLRGKQMGRNWRHNPVEVFCHLHHHIFNQRGFNTALKRGT